MNILNIFVVSIFMAFAIFHHVKPHIVRRVLRIEKNYELLGATEAERRRVYRVMTWIQLAITAVASLLVLARKN